MNKNKLKNKWKKRWKRKEHSNKLMMKISEDKNIKKQN